MTTQEKNLMMAEELEVANKYLKGLAEKLENKIPYSEMYWLKNQSARIEEILRVGKEAQ